MIFPDFYIDTRRECKDLNKESVFNLKIINIKKVYTRKRRTYFIILNGKINNNPVKIIFFNRLYVFNYLKKLRFLKIYTRFEFKQGIYQSTNPLIIKDENNAIYTIYKNFSSIKPGIIKKVINNALLCLNKSKEYLPQFIIKENQILSIEDSFKKIHNPNDLSDISIGKKRFILEEFLFFNLKLQIIRNSFKSKQRILKYTIDNELIKKINSKLKFELTEDQIKTFEDIVNDLKSNKVMNRLIQGDVGSGKTIIAFLSILIAIHNNYQSAFLVPTEVLAFQHYESAKIFFNEYNIEIITGSMSNRERQMIYNKLLNGDIDLLIGTHSLLNEKLKFKNLSLIVIDEQHRFGVYQKAKLYYKSSSTDTLITTATPIPRTMLLSLYKDINTSIIKTMPKNRKPIITRIIRAEERKIFYDKIKDKLKNNKAFIVLPLINKSEFFVSTKSIESEKDFFEDIFKEHKLGFLKGNDDSNYKSSIIKDFKSGKINILISTSVIEVGIDVKDANHIIIEDADRFGLSQLHQLRGRVGRGEIQSYCYLIESININESGKERLKAMERYSNGFDISEIDLKLRGGGIIAGLEQKGFLDFKISTPQENMELFKSSQKQADKLIRNKALRTKEINEFLEEVKENSRQIMFG